MLNKILFFTFFVLMVYGLFRLSPLRRHAHAVHSVVVVLAKVLLIFAFIRLIIGIWI
ncbi:hypothetical protein LNQ82_06895 [Conchiformibius steedae DSM 2580]|uniref:Uncharacterized protein n=1 Tax=Conchiformibius steedae DSM 2580 TaxID=1121352 RepID=A0AAE9HUX8_9NEIS|nr:hypothetical protein [Conchiformibius steedae]QMT34166.1 hypothetical protein H3L98_03975 [Conchiformibius steedae]URD66941.1 hypothetical protein LNQ82_06895 [Conchiformibius steedae DSM 2580]